MKNACFLWLVLIALIPALSAAEPKPRTFRVVSMGATHTEFLYDNGPVKGLRVTTYEGSFSKDYPAPSGGTLAFYRMVAPPADAPPSVRPTKEILAEIAYPKSFERAILLLYSGPLNAPLPLSGHVVDDPVDGHMTGMARVLNLSSLQVAVAAPDQMIQVSPRSLHSLVPFTAGSCRVKVAAEAGGWKEVMDIQRNLAPNLRLFVLLVDAPTSVEGGAPVACALIHDFVRPPMTFKKQDVATPTDGS